MEHGHTHLCTYCVWLFFPATMAHWHLMSWNVYYVILYRKILLTPTIDLVFTFLVVEPIVHNPIFIWTSMKIYSYTYWSEVRGQVGWTLPTHLPPSLFLPSILQQLFLEGNLRNPRGSKEYSLKMTALQQLFENLYIGLGVNKWKFRKN